MTNVFVGLGSNVGDRQKQLSQALGLLRSLDKTKLLRWSTVYETEPVGKKDQPQFLNLVAEVLTDLQPEEFLNALKSIETRVGRSSTERWGPREIDLDILYFGTTILSDGNLKIPHPEVANRRFVLVPMKELAPDFVDPLHQRSVADLLHACPESGTVRSTTMTLHPVE